MAKEKQGRRRFIKGAGLMASSVLSSSFFPSAAVAQSGQTPPATGSKGAQIRSLLAKSEMIVPPRQREDNARSSEGRKGECGCLSR